MIKKCNALQQLHGTAANNKENQEDERGDEEDEDHQDDNYRCKDRCKHQAPTRMITTFTARMRSNTQTLRHCTLSNHIIRSSQTSAEGDYGEI